MKYKDVGFRCGIEIHNRLATEGKLFCDCDARFSKDREKLKVKRKLRAVAGELGEVDVAAAFEFLRGRSFVYNCYPKETCLVDTDSEPPHDINEKAMVVALQIAKMLKAKIPDEIHVMRKTVVDGSNTSAFQRTALVGTDGVLETSKGKVRIDNISIEEESAGIIGDKKDITNFRLDRLGIPLIEIGTATDIKDPEHAKEVAEKLGMIVRSTGKSQRGIGVTRQDVNVSVSGGARVEIKGFQELGMIPTVIEKEVERQLYMIKKGQEPEEETRLAKPDGTTEYMRPLPGGERMYPETDVRPFVVTPELLRKIKLPETWEEKRKRFSKILPKEIADQVLKSEYLNIFEKLSKKHDIKLVATTLTSTIKDLRRNKIPTENLTEAHFNDIFEALEKGKISKEAIPELLEFLSRKPSDTVGHALKDMGLEAITEDKLREIVRKVIAANPEHAKAKRMGPLMGDVMKEVRGRIPGKTVARILREELEKA
ncbi:MAG: Glu-tRNA(Gln) amidotransferase subunit GatE [Candidatus Aenigmatarchaeota archaeon]